MKKIFYAYIVEKAVGAGDDSALKTGGFKQDAAIGPGSYPNPENRITSLSVAIAKGMAWLNRYQADGIDAHVKIFMGVFGADVANPVAAFPGDLDEQVVIARIDGVEKKLRRAIRNANTSTDDTAGGGLDESDGKPELGTG